jgi:hypothetical protein
MLDPAPESQYRVMTVHKRSASKDQRERLALQSNRFNPEKSL